ncbi:hemolysin [Enterobacterales bacterium CwR94]|nr:hemolysin [Enterobacterales bacterium CwR94]
MKLSALSIALPVLMISACQSQPKSDAPPPPNVGMANPASVYCQQKGGKLIPVIDQQGERGDCLLPSGERLDEWTLFRRDHPVKK